MSDNRARIWFGLFVLVVFVFGGATGFVAGRVFPPMRFARMGPPDGPGGDGFRRGGPGGPARGALFGRGPGVPALPPQLLERLTRDVQLDATQREQIGSCWRSAATASKSSTARHASASIRSSATCTERFAHCCDLINNRNSMTSSTVVLRRRIGVRNETDHRSAV